MVFRVAVIGDSAMWGQGLLREQTFAHRAATALAERAGEPLEILPGRSADEPLRGEARSGATLTATVPCWSRWRPAAGAFPRSSRSTDRPGDWST